jgi:signal transduction histidine kinase
MADTSRIFELLKTANQYNFSKADTGLILSEKALAIARTLKYKRGEARALYSRGESYNILGNFPQSLKDQFDALQIYQVLNDRKGQADVLSYIGEVYVQMGEYREALPYFIAAKNIEQRTYGVIDDAFDFSNIGEIYDSLHLPDSSLYYQKQAYQLLPQIERPHLRSFILRHMGNIYAQFGKNDSAIMFYRATIIITSQFDDKVNLSMVQKNMSDLYISMHLYDSALFYAQAAFMNAKKGHAFVQLYDASKSLSSLYRKAGKYDSAFFYADIASATNDNLYGREKFRQMQLLILRQQQNEAATLQAAEQFRNKIKYTFLFIAIGIFVLLATILTRNNRHKQKANELLSEQKAKVEQSLADLKSAQAQLIQREKMASLGEVTAGIAHEIQNPLNFINNFSELNKELIEEAAQARQAGKTGEFDEILATLKANHEKINQHGQRADAIVKGMIQHARPGTGIKEPTNINTLADEYLRLAYNLYCTKDKSFHANLQTDFDESIGRIQIIPQDIGRVLLNIYNNAFYSIAEKKKISQADYNPSVFVSTKGMRDRLFISIKDNGSGIPRQTIGKIFQPFFTTKPTGEGTGLGLSLSYDIVKAHGGELHVESAEGEDTTFFIEIPI